MVGELYVILNLLLTYLFGYHIREIWGEQGFSLPQRPCYDYNIGVREYYILH